MLKGLGQIGDMAKMMKQAQEVQAKMTEAHEGLEHLNVVGEAGAGMVKVEANAKGDILGVTIDPALMDSEQKDVLEDLILAGVKDAQARGRAAAQDAIAKVTEELGLPAGMKLPF
ncbi:YbaB/EbfC family nucleoid-associated protein [Algicella marina]|uniref:Nucleoid-associated protein GO499_01425 n=1 Tax=Algicella marina TaxID=2683284 RepID=A0A6P1STC9_9RHOB|nr:YbaB/EbfC family nucleoid-associated protein [Algicella marina]QHQ33934.1 YbaB/EbfC family nucleoid-associated protein [Algicella marina]